LTGLRIAERHWSPRWPGNTSILLRLLFPGRFCGMKRSVPLRAGYRFLQRVLNVNTLAPTSSARRHALTGGQNAPARRSAFLDTAPCCYLGETTRYLCVSARVGRFILPAFFLLYQHLRISACPARDIPARAPLTALSSPSPQYLPARVCTPTAGSLPYLTAKKTRRGMTPTVLAAPAAAHTQGGCRFLPTFFVLYLRFRIDIPWLVSYAGDRTDADVYVWCSPVFSSL